VRLTISLLRSRARAGCPCLLHYAAVRAAGAKRRDGGPRRHCGHRTAPSDHGARSDGARRYSEGVSVGTTIRNRWPRLKAKGAVLLGLGNERASLAIARMDHATAGRTSGVTGIRGSVGHDRLVVYAHYSGRGVAADWEVACLARARQAGLGVCAVVTSADGSSVDEAPWLDSSDLVLFRRNRGRDLGAYRDAVEYLLRHDYRGSIALTNNSVLWREDAFKRLYRDSEGLGVEIAGATSSLQVAPHLQSFWLWVAPGVLSTPAARALIGGWRNYRTRSAAIVYGELPVSSSTTARGLRAGAVFPYERVVDELRRAEAHPTGSHPSTVARRQLVLSVVDNGHPLNPTHFMWSELLALGLPGIKRDLVALNPARIGDHNQIEVVARQYGLNVDSYEGTKAVRSRADLYR
jgi:hypothetical protein